MGKTAVILFLGLLLTACKSAQSPPPTQPATQPKPVQGPVSGTASQPAVQGTAPRAQTPANLPGEDIAKIIVFPSPREAIYELEHGLSEGRIEIFNNGEITAQYPLPDLSAGRHILVLEQSFYWPEKDETLPDPLLSCTVGTGYITMGSGDLWGQTTYSGPSVYDYRPPPPPKKVGDPVDLAAAYRGDELGFSQFNVPYKRNQELRNAGELPELEILGVGFVEGTPVECGQGQNPEKFYTAPLRDVRVVSTLSHDLDPATPVLKAAKFTVPRGAFTYPNHIRIVGRPK
jgi:hypothetical protein